MGSGFENHAKYAESVYFKSNDNKSLYVNLYIPTELDWKEKGFKLLQNNNFPEVEATSFTVIESSGEPLTINLRKPYWAKNVNVKINGKKQKVEKSDNGYLSIGRKWKKGDKIELEFDTELRMEKTPVENLTTIFYGPLLLAGRLGTEGMTEPAPTSNPELYNDYYTYDYNIPEGIEKTLDFGNLRKLDKLKWETSEGVVIEPLYDIHGERHQIFWKN